MKTALQIIFVFVILGLGYLIYDSINQPIEFQDQQAKRQTAVVNRLKMIREAQVAYKSIYEKYTGSFDTLIDFVKTGNFKITKNEGSLTDSMLNAGMTEKEALKLGIIKRDTVLVSVKDSLCGELDPDSLRFVPFSPDKAQFEIAATALTSSSGLVIPVFEASVTNKVYLKGLDNQERINLDDMAKKLGRFPGLKVGSVEEANNNAGNWE
ncbi:MAG: hypothetical protein MJZ13_09290 [Bacteroidales bacterium]|nr:hypothetical protein [Bacteroidales bacterium]